MKKILLFLLFIYQTAVSPFLHAITGTHRACRYPVSCSEYARQAIVKYGAIHGGLLALKRLSSCHPFQKHPGLGIM